MWHRIEAGSLHGSPRKQDISKHFEKDIKGLFDVLYFFK